MDEIVPLQFINKNFQLEILKLKQVSHCRFYVLYEAITIFGNMTLIIENYTDNIDGFSTIQFLKKRENLMKLTPQNFPLIYEHHISVNHPQQIICMTLMQSCSPFSIEKVQEKIKIRTIKKIVLSASIIQQHYFELEDQNMPELLQLKYSQQLCLNFTRIRPAEIHRQGKKLFNQIVECIQRLMTIDSAKVDKIKEIIFIKDRIYTFSPQLLSKANDFFELAMFLNIFPQPQVQVESQVLLPTTQTTQTTQTTELHRRKLTKIKNLQGSPCIIYKGVQYCSLLFVEGKCINSLTQIFYKELAQKFIRSSSHYKLQKQENLIVEISEGKKSLHQPESNEEQSITIFPTVTKIELINFLIAYIKCIEPTIYSITYAASTNCLTLEFNNQLAVKKTLQMVFHEDYVIKEEQISIIIQKSRIKNCKVDTRFMKVSDSFLMFLANSQKLKNINELYLSDCYGLSDTGISVLLVSPFCKNLKTLSLTSRYGLFDSAAIEAISVKSGLKKLQIVKCTLAGSFESPKSMLNRVIDLSKMKLESLTSLGISINLNTLAISNLKYLFLDQPISIEQFRNLRHLELIQLKALLIESQKKSLMHSISMPFTASLQNKNNPIKLFAQGPSNKTLRVLDLSNSSIKFKTVRSLFLMSELNKLVLDNCGQIAYQVEAISPKILHLSLHNLPIGAEQLSILLHHTNVLIDLNLIGTKISKKELLNFIITTKKYVKNLKISEEQYCNKLIEKVSAKSNSFQYLENVEVEVNKLLRPEQEVMFHYMLFRASQSNKTLKLLIPLNEEKAISIRKNSSTFNSDDFSENQEIEVNRTKERKRRVLLDKIKKYLMISSQNVNHLKNLYINEIRYEQIFMRESQDLNFEQRSTNYSSEVELNKKQLIQGQMTLFNVFHYQTIDQITYRFVKFIKEKNSLPISIDLSCNKLIDKNIIKMLLLYGSENVRVIDFRQCLFKFSEIIEDLFQFTWLEQLNRGEYDINLNRENFINHSQKYLKLLMRVKPIQSLSIICSETEEIQILFSVLYHIVDQHSSSITKLILQFDGILINSESLMFMEKIFKIQQLRHLQFSVNESCIIQDEAVFKIWAQGIKSVDLVYLDLRLPSRDFPIVRMSNLETLIVSFSDNKIQEGAVYKSFREIVYANHLKSINLSLGNCENISNLSKVFNGVGLPGVGAGFIEKLQKLQSLTLNFQYCPLKEHTLFDFIKGLSKCGNLKYLDVNVSFAVANFNDLLSSIEKMMEELNRAICVKIICVNEKSNNFMFNQQEMSQQGVQFIL